MDSMSILAEVVAVIETGALIGGMVFLTKAIKEKKNGDARRTRFIQGAIYLAAFFALNLVRNSYL